MHAQAKSANVLSPYGFKQVSIANLFDVDDHPSYPSPLRGEKWLKELGSMSVNVGKCRCFSRCLMKVLTALIVSAPSPTKSF
jgi:hypothetical protein